MNSSVSPHRVQRWLQHPGVFSLWCIVAAFGSYACMYGFRKPFTAGSYVGTDFGTQLKTWLVMAQVLGYMLSKFVGIKVIAEMPAARRAITLIGLLGVAEIALALFAITPVPYSAVWLFLNGLSLGMVFGLVLGFVEGRRMTEMFVGGLCASFILADGFSKSIGASLLVAGVSEHWMPAVAGLVFALPLLVFVWMLSQIPAPDNRDVLARSERQPMTREQRRAMIQRHGIRLLGIVLVYLLITILRGLRGDFAPEIWSGLGFESQPSVFAISEMWVALGVVGINGALVLVRNNRLAFFFSLVLCVGGLTLGLFTLLLQQRGLLSPFAFMVMLGVGMYVPYVAVHTTIFERLIALTRERGNIGFLLYLADSFGYLGYVVMLLCRNAFPQKEQFLSFFLSSTLGLLTIAVVVMAATLLAYARRMPHEEVVKPSESNLGYNAV